MGGLSQQFSACQGIISVFHFAHHLVTIAWHLQGSPPIFQSKKEWTYFPCYWHLCHKGTLPFKVIWGANMTERLNKLCVFVAVTKMCLLAHQPHSCGLAVTMCHLLLLYGIELWTLLAQYFHLSCFHSTSQNLWFPNVLLPEKEEKDILHKVPKWSIA